MTSEVKAVSEPASTKPAETTVPDHHNNAPKDDGAPAALERGSHDGEIGHVALGEVIVVPGTTLLDILGKWELGIAWVGLLLVSLTNYLDAVTVGTYNTYALSEYGRLSMEGAMSTIFGVIAIAIQGILATLARELHSFNIVAFSVSVITLAFLLEASSPVVVAFICGHACYVVGLMTSKFMIFLLGSELSNLRHRSFALGAVNLPAMISQLGGAKMAEKVLNSLGWRWGIGMWCILIPACSIPLLTILFMSKRRTRHARVEAYGGKTGALPRTLHVWNELLKGDLLGCLLLAAGCALFFLPIPLEHRGIAAYAKARNVVPTVIGFLVLIVFFVWEVKYSPKPLFPARLVRNRNVFGPFLLVLCANFAMAFVPPYFFVYLMVRSKLSISGATYVTLTPWLTNAFAQFVYGAVVSWTKRPKWVIVVTSGLLLVATGLQYAFQDPDTQLAGLVASQVLLGFGYGGVMTALIPAQAKSRTEDVPSLVAGFIIVTQFGSTIAGAVAGGIWTSTLIANLQKYLPGALKDQSRTIMGDLTIIQSYEWGSPEREAINLAHGDTWSMILLGSIVAAAVSFACSFIGEDVNLAVIDEERRLEKEQAQVNKLEGKVGDKE